MHLLIDGNNLIHFLPELLWGASAEGRPAALAACIKPYRDTKKLKITLFFDGGEQGSKASLSGVPVVFSGPEKSADQVILECLRGRGGAGFALVSNDRALGQAAQAFGAQVIGAADLAGRLLRSQGIAPGDDPGWNFSTRKKGPSRRLPKAKRTHGKILDKL